MGDLCDVCPARPDPGQSDADGDGRGDACPAGDVDGDLDVDADDLFLIGSGIPVRESDPFDPRDVDGDGAIDGQDLRDTMQRCTRDDCAVEESSGCGRGADLALLVLLPSVWQASRRAGGRTPGPCDRDR